MIMIRIEAVELKWRAIPAWVIDGTPIKQSEIAVLGWLEYGLHAVFLKFFKIETLKSVILSSIWIRQEFNFVLTVECHNFMTTFAFVLWMNEWNETQLRPIVFNPQIELIFVKIFVSKVESAIEVRWDFEKSIKNLGFCSLIHYIARVLQAFDFFFLGTIKPRIWLLLESLNFEKADTIVN